MVEYFHASGIEARLRAEIDYCAFDVTIDGNHSTAALEVLMQPVDRVGLPCGSPVSLLKETLDMLYIERKGQSFGRSWLPGIEPSIAANCYYRVTPL